MSTVDRIDFCSGTLCAQATNVRARKSAALFDMHADSRMPAVPRPPVSAIVHTLNEIEQIEDCLRSIEWADEVYLVDSFSTDGTVERVREKFPKARVEQREYLGAASTKNYAIDRAAHDWIFVLDADERVTPELRDEILRTLEGPLDHWAYSVGR